MYVCLLKFLSGRVQLKDFWKIFQEVEWVNKLRICCMFELDILKGSKDEAVLM